MRILVLGGTAEARALASSLDAAGVPFESSLAGRVSRPRLPVGPVRIGGFGGAEGLARYIDDRGVTHVVDATHPFAVTMSAHAVEAGLQTAAPVLRLARPGWEGRPDASSWHWVSTLDEMRTTAERLGSRPFVSTGRQTLEAFGSWAGRNVLVRVVEPLTGTPPDCWTVIEDRGPYVAPDEREMLSRHGIDVLLTKDSGGSYTSAKLGAASELGIPVVVLRRPRTQPGAVELTSVEACVERLLAAAPGR
ncbi:cobalt-precorrin-6A reductase [Dermatophilaceae bacterium Soc4.6]